MRRDRSARIGAVSAVLAAVAVLAGLIAPAASAQDWSPPTTVWVERTGHTVDGLFLDDWRSNQALFGQPITEELTAKVAIAGDRAGRRSVQYFENLAVVRVPEETRDGWQVQMLPLGLDALRADSAKLKPLHLPKTGSCASLGDDSCVVFSKTHHSLRFGFKTFWNENDGERLLGKPLTEEFVDAKGVTTQYFENVVLRWKTGHDVSARAIGKETAKRLKVKTAKIAQPLGVPIYDESLFQPPIEAGVGGSNLGKGPGPQQGGAKEIVVSISQESMWAYENGKLVASSLVSTGVGNVPETVTPTGFFSVLVKFDTETMEGTISGEHYRIEDVPYVMYFDNAGNALHGAYWHNNFGNPMSHGCVNLPMDVAAFLYDWAPVGTAVTIID